MLQSKRSTAFKLLFTALVIVGAVLIMFFGYKLYLSRGKIIGYAKLSANSSIGSSRVFLDGKELGTTPLNFSGIKPGMHTVKLSSDLNSYETELLFSKNSQAVIVRNLGVSQFFSSGQTFSLDDKDLSSKINVVSSPSQSKVFIDNEEVGKTPYASAIINEGDHELRVEKEGYEKQTAIIKIQNKYKLNVSVSLFPILLTGEEKKIDGSEVLYDLSSSNEALFSDTAVWARAVAYKDKANEKKFNFIYFVDFLGNIFDVNGLKIEEGGLSPLKKDNPQNIGYLGRTSDNGVTTEATTSFNRFSADFVVYPRSGVRLRVLQTGTGWLRVRKDASTTSDEIGRLNVGDIVFALEEKTGWYKIRMKDGKLGWVSSAYAVKDSSGY